MLIALSFCLSQSAWAQINRSGVVVEEEFNILPDPNAKYDPALGAELSEEYFPDGSHCDCPRCVARRSQFHGPWSPMRRGGPIVIGAAGQCVTLYDVRVSADYLLYSIEGMDLPALVTTSPVGTAPANIGVLGRSTTQTLFGGNLNEDARSGGRIGVSLWTDPDLHTSWEFAYLGLEQKGEEFRATSNTTRNIARPFFDTATNSEAAQLIAQSGVLSGSVFVDSETQLQTIEVLRRHCFCRTPWYQYDLILGYKYGLLEDSLSINQSSTYLVASGPIVAGTTANAFDRFETSNRFNGFVIGLDRWHNWNCWRLMYTGKVALGSTRSRATISGRTTNTVPGAGSASFQGGLLAQSSNIGRFERDQFMAIPEFTVRLERRITSQLQLHAAYNLMYWTAVTRVDDVFNRRVSQFPPEPITGARQPAFRWSDDGMLVHGMQIGVDYNF